MMYIGICLIIYGRTLSSVKKFSFQLFQLIFDTIERIQFFDKHHCSSDIVVRLSLFLIILMQR